MKYKLLILDFDGTIGDTRGSIVKTMQETITKLRLPFRSEEQCAAMIGLPLKQTFTDLIPMDDSAGERCAEVYAEVFKKYTQPGSVKAFPHVAETISELYSRGIIISIATSRKRPSLVAFLQEMKLEKYITQIVTVQDVAHAKSAPDMVLKILCDSSSHVSNPSDSSMSGSSMRCCVLPQEALTVGDTIFDIKMGRSAGTSTCGVTYGNGKKADLATAGADHLIDDFAELLRICK